MASNASNFVLTSKTFLPLSRTLTPLVAILRQKTELKFSDLLMRLASAEDVKMFFPSATSAQSRTEFLLVMNARKSLKTENKRFTILILKVLQANSPVK